MLSGGGGLLSGGGLGEHRSVPGGPIASSGASGYGGLRKEGSFGSGAAGSAYNTPASSLPAASGSRFGRLAQFGMNQGSGAQAPHQSQGQGQQQQGYGRHKF
jgi:hypothetical protein